MSKSLFVALGSEDGRRENEHGIYWFLNGKLDREDGPAMEYFSGSKVWWKNGKVHREDGPAVEWDDGFLEWWKDGILIRRSM